MDEKTAKFIEKINEILNVWGPINNPVQPKRAHMMLGKLRDDLLKEGQENPAVHRYPEPEKELENSEGLLEY